MKILPDIYKTKLNFLFYRYKYLIRYVIIGLGSIIVEILMILVLKQFDFLLNLRFGRQIILGISFLTAVLFAFILNSKLNFPVPKERNLRTFRMFLIISTLAFGLNIGIMKLIVTPIISFSYYIMRFITAGIVFMMSYTLHRKFTFTDIKEVGIAAYLNNSEDISKIKSRIKVLPDFIHIDLVDKSFNPDAEEVEFSIGEQIRNEWPLVKKMVHIMSKYPSKWVDKVSEFANCIIFHYEIGENIDDVINLCKSKNKKIGISIKHDTPIDSILKYLNDIDVVQILGIEKPGESSQDLHPLAIDKLNTLNFLKDKYNFEICFDGGVKLANIKKINAKYIVSSSEILNSINPKKTLFDLKTSSMYYLESEKDLKKYINKKIKQIIESLDFVVSGNIVGSFATSKGIEGISDIDLVIIVDELTKNKFDEIINKFKELENKIKVNYDYDMIINPTLGPLKFNKEKTVVFHLMIYDKESHKEHCIKSPFTCLDWQNSKVYFKAPMNSVYEVTNLQPNYFFNSRRSVKDYLDDLNSNSISYREYKFSDGVSEIKKSKIMENRDKIEFSYHIMKFCMTNFLKLYYDINKVYTTEELVEKYFNIFPLNSMKYKSYFIDLEKQKKSLEFQNIDSKIISDFLNDFERQFKEFFTTKLFFIRHQITELNDKGMFLGQKSDPDIINNNIKINLKNIRNIYSSPLKRCIQTVDIIKEDLSIPQYIVDNNLKEINYGLIDGKGIDELKLKYPNIIKQWDKGKDPRFPEGENTQDVLNRVNNFLSSINKEGDSLICTHNIFLRCLIGHYFKIPKDKWYLIEIPHIEPIELVLGKNNKFYINLTTKQIDSFFEKT